MLIFAPNPIKVVSISPYLGEDLNFKFSKLQKKIQNCAGLLALSKTPQSASVETWQTLGDISPPSSSVRDLLVLP